MQWTHSFSRSSDAPVRRLTFTGDWAPVWRYESLYQSDPLGVYGDLLPYFKQSDLNFVNVETAISDRGEPISKNGPCIRIAPSAAAALPEVPFHVACLANNHVLDYGAEALEDTLHHLSAVGLQTTGAGMSAAEVFQPLELMVEGQRVTVINCGEGEACASEGGNPGAWLYETRMVEGAIRARRAAGELVIVVFHGGREVVPLPPPYVVGILRGMVEAGAHAVIAHHPHVPQGMEIYRGSPIIYSLGNFLFRYQTPSYYQQVGLLAHLDIAGGEVAGVSLTPYRMADEGLREIVGEERERLRAELQSWTDLLADPAAIDEMWHAFLETLFPDVASVLAPLAQLQAMAAEDGATAAAKAHNYFLAPAHRTAILDALYRAAREPERRAAPWAVERLKQWKQTTV